MPQKLSTTVGRNKLNRKISHAGDITNLFFFFIFVVVVLVLFVHVLASFKST